MLAEVIAAESEFTVAGRVTVVVEPPPTLKAPAWDGLVTAMPTRSGSKVSEGTVLISIDGIDRVLVATAMPPFRPLAAGDSGPDVAELAGYLAREGFLPEEAREADRVDDQYLSALNAFAASLGIDSGEDGAAFDPGWVVWSPTSEPGRLLGMNAVVGEPAPSPGGDLATLGADVSRAAWEVDAVTGSHDDVTGLVIQGSTHRFVVDGDALVLDEAGTAELQRLVQQQLAESGLTVETADQGDAGGSTELVMPAEVSLEGQNTIHGSVPITALVSRSTGESCVVVEAAGRWATKTVEVVRSNTALGAATVTGLAVGEDTVVVNPWASTLAERCG